VRGGDWRNYPKAVSAGIVLHRAIDVETDNHAAVRTARVRFPTPFRRFAGIILDIFFDHFLARNWPQYYDQPLANFAEENYRWFAAQRDLLPASAQWFTDHMVANNLLVNYRDLDCLAQVFAGLGRRLRRPNPLPEAVLLLSDRTIRIELETAFAALMPGLIQFAHDQQPKVVARVESSV